MAGRSHQPCRESCITWSDSRCLTKASVQPPLYLARVRAPGSGTQNIASPGLDLLPFWEVGAPVTVSESLGEPCLTAVTPSAPDILLALQTLMGMCLYL